jgi:CRP-like cAMP-binding protein
VLGPGEHFGETALLRGVRDDFAASARTLVLLYALDGRAFGEAVASNRRSWEAVVDVISKRRRFDVDDSRRGGSVVLATPPVSVSGDGRSRLP